MKHRVITRADFDNPCPECKGVRFYIETDECMRCRILKNAKANAAKKAELKLVHDANNIPKPRHRPFTVEEIKTDEFRNFERLIMVGVKYEDMIGRLM